MDTWSGNTEGERGPTQTAALLYNSKAATSSPDFYLINNLTVYFSIHQQCCSLRRNRVVFQWKWKRLNCDCDLPVIKLFLPLKYLGSGINENEETSWKINAKAEWSKNGITKIRKYLDRKLHISHPLTSTYINITIINTVTTVPS